MVNIRKKVEQLESILELQRNLRVGAANGMGTVHNAIVPDLEGRLREALKATNREGILTIAVDPAQTIIARVQAYMLLAIGELKSYSAGSLYLIQEARELLRGRGGMPRIGDDLRLLEAYTTKFLSEALRNQAADLFSQMPIGRDPELLRAAAEVFTSGKFYHPVSPTSDPVGIITVGDHKRVLRFSRQEQSLKAEWAQYEFFRRMQRLVPEYRRRIAVPGVFGIVELNEGQYPFALLRDWVEGKTALDTLTELREQASAGNGNPAAMRAVQQYHYLIQQLFQQVTFTSGLGPLFNAPPPPKHYPPLPPSEHYRGRLQTGIIAPVSAFLQSHGVLAISSEDYATLDVVLAPLSQLLAEQPTVYYKDSYPNNIIIGGGAFPDPQFTNIDFATKFGQAPLHISLATLIAFGTRLTDTTFERQLMQRAFGGYEAACRVFNSIAARVQQDDDQFVIEEIARDIADLPLSVSQRDLQWVLMQYSTADPSARTALQKLKAVQHKASRDRWESAGSYVYNLRYFLRNLKGKESLLEGAELTEDRLDREMPVFYAALTHRALWMAGLHASWAPILRDANRHREFTKFINGIAGALDTAIYAVHQYHQTGGTWGVQSSLVGTPPQPYVQFITVLSTIRERFGKLCENLRIGPYSGDPSVTGAKIASD